MKINALLKSPSLFLSLILIGGSSLIAQTPIQDRPNIKTYIDQQNGKTADELVAYALNRNPELEAIRKETEASEALIRQAGLRSNPNLELSSTKNPLSPSNTLMIKGSLPLELFGRRQSRVNVAARTAEVKDFVLADRERALAKNVRIKFGETLALALKLSFVEESLEIAIRNYALVVSRVSEGRNAPLEQNMELVELNRIRATRETAEGRLRIAMYELKNTVGMEPDAVLVVKGNFNDLLDPIPPRSIAEQQALLTRPDLQTLRTMVDLANARIVQAKAQGKPDASASVGYQRMNSGFPFRAYDNNQELVPIRSVFNFITFGVTINLPIFNNNSGSIEANILEKNASLKRVEFGELTVRREIVAAYADYYSKAKAMEIFRVGVEKQAEENLDVVRQTYELGSRSLLDYIAEQRRFIDIKNEFIDMQRDVYNARIEIMRALNSPKLINK